MTKTWNTEIIRMHKKINRPNKKRRKCGRDVEVIIIPPKKGEETTTRNF